MKSISAIRLLLSFMFLSFCGNYLEKKIPKPSESLRMKALPLTSRRSTNRLLAAGILSAGYELAERFQPY